MREETRLLLDSMGRLFADHCTKEVIDRAEGGAFPAALWRAVADTGMPLAALSEAAGGVEAEWSDAFAVLRIAGRHAAPIPLAETMLAAWVATAAGLPVPNGPLTFAPVRAQDRLNLERDGTGWRLSGEARRVPWCTQAARVIVVADGPGGAFVLALERDEAMQIVPGRNLAGEPRETLQFAALKLAADAARPAKQAIDRHALYRRGALARAVQISGALEKALEISVGYALERHQFGRPIAKFQAIQQQIAVLAGQVAAAVAASDAATEALSRGDPTLEEFLIAVAKTRAGEAATLGAEIAHQVHGAIGYTQEYALQPLTRRLWSWRDEFGAEAEWASRVGALVCARGADALWPTLTEA